MIAQPSLAWTHGSAGAGPTPVMTETIQNFAASTSPGFFRQGLQFKKGDCPSGSVPVLTLGGTVVDIQFDERVTWSDGSLKTCVANFRSATWSANESRSAVWSVQTGSFNNTGTKTLADITGAHTFNVAFSSVTQYNGSTTVTRGSGAFTADFNTQSATATRVTKYHSGPVCESWEVWGMATDNTGGAADAHLKTVWYVTIWKNSNGTIADFEYGAVVAQDWWDVASKFRLNYTATLQDASSAKYTYSTIQHPYRAHWMTVRTDNDDNHARRPWVTQIPTLVRQMNKTYAVSTGLFPPLDTTFTPNSNATIGYTSNYTPCSAQNHRADIDGTGSYMGRGLMPNSDCVAFMRQTSGDYRYARTNAFAGLHIPYHYHSNATRTRPTEGADTANTVISLIMRPLSAPSYDFTAQGMPAAIDAYTGTNVAPVTTTYVAPTGGTGVWTISADSTHAVPFSYFMYMLEGERHFMQATLDLATNCCHQQNGNTFGGAPQANYFGVAPFQTLLSIPSTQYSGIGGARPLAANARNAGWGMLLIAQADVVCPDADVQKGFITLYRQQQGAFTVFNMLYMEPNQLSQGNYGTFSGSAPYVSAPWMANFQTLGHAFNVVANEDSNSLSAINTCLQFTPVAPWENSNAQPYRSNDYREMLLLKTTTTYDRATNPFLPRAGVLLQVDCTVSGNVITANIDTHLGPTNGDVLYFSNTQGSTNNTVSIPAGFTAGTAYYWVNCSGQTGQVAATLGGSPMTIADGTCSIGYQPAVWPTTPAQNPPYLPQSDDYPPINVAALIAAKRAGANAITNTHITNALAFVAPIDYSSWVTWKMAA